MATEMFNQCAYCMRSSRGSVEITLGFTTAPPGWWRSLVCPVHGIRTYWTEFYIEIGIKRLEIAYVPADDKWLCLWAPEWHVSEVLLAEMQAVLRGTVSSIITLHIGGALRRPTGRNCENSFQLSQSFLDILFNKMYL